MAFDHDLDMFAASISLARTSVAALIKEEGLCFLFYLHYLRSLGVLTGLFCIQKRYNLGHGRL